MCSLTMLTLVVLVYELITCVQQANENAGNLISVVQFLIYIHIYICSLSVLGVSSNLIGWLSWGNSALFTHQGLNNAQSK